MQTVLPNPVDKVVHCEFGHAVITGHGHRYSATVEVDEMGVSCHLTKPCTWNDRKERNRERDRDSEREKEGVTDRGEVQVGSGENEQEGG